MGTHFERVIAVDPVEAMLQGARHRIEASDVRQVDIRQGDLSSLPIDTGSIDLAIAMLVLHHVPVPQEALTEVVRILRPGGRVLIVEQVEHASEAFRDRMQDRWWGFDPPQLAGMLTATGFRRVHTNELTSLQRAHDAPDLFVLTGVKLSNGDGKSPARHYEKKKEP